MTMNDAMNGGIDDGLEPIETLPHDDIAKVEGADVRHLAIGAATETLCGLLREGLTTAHPSKAKRTDCLACRNVYRTKGLPPAPDVTRKTGDRVEFPDGSVWLVEDARKGGLDVRCVISGGDNKKGRRSTISVDSPLRVFTEAEFEATLVREREANEAAAKAATPAPTADGTPAPVKVRATTKWTPTKFDVDEVRRLRALGRSYIAIETEMGWPDGHGNRPFRIMKGAWQYDLLREK